MIVNSIWMFVSPLSWYHELPAAVPDFGPYNRHFIRDIGGAYLACALSLLYSAFYINARLYGILFSSLFFGFHAATHVFETFVGEVSSSHWWIDMPGVYVPFILLSICGYLVFKDKNNYTSSEELDLKRRKSL